MNNRLKSGFGIRLREERKRLGLSQVDFARKAGIERVSQHLYEKEENSPQVRYLYAISEFGVDINYLLFKIRADPVRLSFNPSLLLAIYRATDELSRDKYGELLPLDTRLRNFGLLCTAYSGREDDQIDMDTLRLMLDK